MSWGVIYIYYFLLCLQYYFLSFFNSCHALERDMHCVLSHIVMLHATHDFVAVKCAICYTFMTRLPAFFLAVNKTKLWWCPFNQLRCHLRWWNFRIFDQSPSHKAGWGGWWWKIYYILQWCFDVTLGRLRMQSNFPPTNQILDCLITAMSTK